MSNTEPPKYYAEDTSLQVRQQRTVVQAHLRLKFDLPVEERDHTEAASPSEPGVENTDTQSRHPTIGDKQFLDGSDRKLNTNFSQTDLENVLRDQENEKQLRLGNRPSNSNQPRYGSTPTPRPS